MPLAFEQLHPDGMSENSPGFQPWDCGPSAPSPEGTADERCLGRPFGTDPWGRPYPRLKPWAILARPSGTGACPGLGALASPQSLVALGGEACPVRPGRISTLPPAYPRRSSLSSMKWRRGQGRGGTFGSKPAIFRQPGPPSPQPSPAPSSQEREKTRGSARVRRFGWAHLVGSTIITGANSLSPRRRSGERVRERGIPTTSSRSNPSPQPSPRSSLAGRGRQRAVWWYEQDAPGSALAVALLSLSVWFHN